MKATASNRRFILAASIAISWCFPNGPAENTSYSRAVRKQLEQTNAIVPEIWAFEIANGIFVAHNVRKRIAEADIQEYIQLLESLPILVISGDWTKNIALCPFGRPA